MTENPGKIIHTIGSFEFNLIACDCGIDKFEHPEGRGVDRHIIHLYPKDETHKHIFKKLSSI